MALEKAVKQENGLVLNYHQVLFIHSAINARTSIAVRSYLDKESREMEAENQTPYNQVVTYETDYVENMTIEDAYEYLKRIPIFVEAIDV